MDKLIILKVFSVFSTLISAIIGGLWPFFKKANYNAQTGQCGFPVGEALTTGIFLAAALLHMLPDANVGFNEAGYHYPFAFLTAAVSFLVLLMLEHIGVSWSHKTTSILASLVFITLTMLSIHSLFEGAAVGMAANFATATVIIIAILAHKGAASFALSMQLNRSNLSFVTRLSVFSFFAVMTPLGIIGGNWILSTTASNVLLTPIFNALAAGTFLYIGTLHGLGRANLITQCCNMKEFTYMLLGFTLMALVAVWT